MSAVTGDTNKNQSTSPPLELLRLTQQRKGGWPYERLHQRLRTVQELLARPGDGVQDTG